MTEQELAERVVSDMMDADAFSRWLGVELVELRPGYCTVRMTVRPEMVNGFGIAHGGIAYALADSAMAFASNSYGTVAVALNNSITYPAKLVPGDEVVATAAEVSSTRRTAVYDCSIVRGETLVALFRGSVYRTGKPHRAAAGRTSDDHRSE